MEILANSEPCECGMLNVNLAHGSVSAAWVLGIPGRRMEPESLS